ncbi:MAG: acyltransferase family protein, partial [Planctomycetia bacterium]
MTESPPAPAASSRLTSLDALRGFDMSCLVLFDRIVRGLHAALPNVWIVTALHAQFTHPDWVGFTFYDLIFPLFEYMIGVSVYLSVSKRLARGDSKISILKHALVRVALMVLLGMTVNGNLLTWNPAELQLTYSVLQMLAVAYLFATLFVLYAGLRGQIVGFLVLLVGYWAVQTYVPLPGEPRAFVNWMGATVEAPAHQVGVYKEGSHFSYWLDDKIFGEWDRWKAGWIVESMTHGASALVGVFAARVLRSGMTPWRVVLALAAAGVLSLAGGWAWSLSFPIIKNMWTSTFVLWTSGVSLLLTAGFYGVVDGLGWRRWAFPFIVVGSNSIVAYLMSTVLSGVVGSFTFLLLGGFAPYLGKWH